MLKALHRVPTRYPKAILTVILALTVAAGYAMKRLHFETDARVYFPKGHPAIAYDELVADVFHVKDSIIIAVENENGIYNPETLSRIWRITDKVSELPGVLAQRKVDIASLSTATAFIGTADSLQTVPLMESPNPDAAQIERMKKLIYDNPELFVGNLVSKDGKAAMIRIKLKEGIQHRYSSYFAVKGILMGEIGGGAGGGSGDWQKWQQGGQGQGGVQGQTGTGPTAQVETASNHRQQDANNTDDAKPDAGKDQAGSTRDANQGAGGWKGQGAWKGGSSGWSSWNQDLVSLKASNGDHFYMAGRPVIEVTSGQHALADLAVMVPLLIVAIIVVLFLMFRNVRGVVLPLAVVVITVIWTMGFMAALNVPLYTISTMMPVILVAVGIGCALHILSHYQDIVVVDPQRDRRDIVDQVMSELSMPLFITTATTAVGFLSLLWAEMPPFRVFGAFTAIGVAFCWLISITLVPAALSLMRPHVAGYLARRRNMRVHAESSLLARVLVRVASGLMAYRAIAAVIIIAVVAVVGYGGSRLYVDSSWIADFKKTSEVIVSNDALNKAFNGTIFLNVVVDGHHPDSLKSPELLNRMQDLVKHTEGLEYVGGSVSLLDFIKTTNKTLHEQDPAHYVLPQTRQEIGEILFLLSVSGRPELLDEVVNYDYSQANLTFAIKTDHTQKLKAIIDSVKDYAAREFAGLDVDINTAGSANNSYVWAQLLINSQIMSILLSKIGILLMAVIMFRSFAAGLHTVIPVTATTILVGGAAGWLGIPLDVSTVLAAGVAIGVGVDYAVHYVSRYALERSRGLDEHAAVVAAMRSVGKPIVFNATVVAAGFLILGFSQFPPHIKLGLFVATYMAVSCLAALIILPVTFAFSHPRFKGATDEEP
jgi:predicted RND superfamily exporter protein